jgi:myosin heavy subunit
LENKKHGIFAQCDERLKLKAAVSHEVLAKDLYAKCSSSPFFVAEAQHQRKHQFVMKHFAGDVLYSTELFLEKNRSEVAPELTNCLRDSRSPFVRQLADTFDQVEEAMSAARAPSVRLVSPMKGMHGGGFDSERRLSPRKQAPPSHFKTPSKTGSVSFNVDSNTPSSDSALAHRSPGYSRSASTGMGSATRGALQVGVSPKLAPLRRRRQQTVLSQFTKQLQELMDSVKTTRSHFIRCIKPNVLMSPDSYDCGLVMSQLRCGGVLGAVQVFRAGFPNRFDFSYFVTKYSSFAFVCGQNSLTKDFYKLRRRATATAHDSFWRAACTALLTIVPMADAILTILGIRSHHGNVAAKGRDPLLNVEVVDVQSILASSSSCGEETAAMIRDGMCLGRSQVFLRAPVFEYLEQLQLRATTLVVQLVQRHWRAFRAVALTVQERPGMRRSRSSINRIAFAVDNIADRKRRMAIRITSAAISVQRQVRVFLAVRRLRKAIFLSVWVSSHYRGYKAREGVRQLKWRSASIIQSVWRGKLQKNRYLSMRASAVIVQNWVRRVRYRLLLRKEMRLRVQAQWSTLKLQSQWRRKSARRATMSLVIARVSCHPCIKSFM